MKSKSGGMGMKNNIMFAIVLILGIILGAFLGDVLGKYETWEWLNYGKEIGLKEPFILDLYILKLTFAIMINITIASIIGFVIAAFAYKKYI